LGSCHGTTAEGVLPSSPFARAMPADTVSEAPADRTVEGAVCLEAGAGTARMVDALLEASAGTVYR